MFGTKQLKSAVRAFSGLVLLVFVAVAALAFFSTTISVSTFVSLAFVVAAAALVFGYFNWMPVRASLLFVVTVTVLLIGVVFFKPPGIKTSQFQAVFLTNNQVYFGHLKDIGSKNPVLTDIYYLQSSPNNPQQGSQTTAQTQLSLVKLGKELHGPEDSMKLQKDQILFWENLTNNGKVVQAIHDNQKKK